MSLSSMKNTERKRVCDSSGLSDYKQDFSSSVIQLFTYWPWSKRMLSSTNTSLYPTVSLLITILRGLHGDDGLDLLLDDAGGRGEAPALLAAVIQER